MNDAGDTLANAANLWTISAGIGSAIVTYIAMRVGKANDDGKFEGEVKNFMNTTSSELEDLREKHEAHVNLVRSDIGRLSEQDNRTRDQLADIRASMAQRSDLTAISTAIASLSARIDDVFGRK